MKTLEEIQELVFNKRKHIAEEFIKLKEDIEFRLIDAVFNKYNLCNIPFIEKDVINPITRELDDAGYEFSYCKTPDGNFCLSINTLKSNNEKFD